MVRVTPHPPVPRPAASKTKTGHRPSSVLLTGGAGFIGSHVTDALLREGYQVRILDLLVPQVHGSQRARPSYLDESAELVAGDVRDPKAVREALDGIDAVIHLAAAVGVGQSMYQVADYISANTLGTAVLLQALIEQPVQRLVVASSMSIYGEGLYHSSEGEIAVPIERRLDRNAEGREQAWDPRDELGNAIQPVPTPETKAPSLASVYALSKYDQEQLCLMIGRAYGIPTIALRLFNVFGIRQALSNPYTGVVAIFLSRLLNENPPLIFEDGCQRRDFVHVSDVARAFCLALSSPHANEVVNIGSGSSCTIKDLAVRAAAAVGKPHIQPRITGKYRVGDIRHCFADISKARELLGYEPSMGIDEGLEELAGWLRHQQAHDLVDRAFEELAARGLAV